MTPGVSIIITTRNRAGYLKDTLASFRGLIVPRELSVELLVVDNGSSDETGAIVGATRLARIPVRYMHERKPGQCNARNTGMANTTGEIILFTDDDVRVPANWIQGIAGPILSGKADAVAGGVKIAASLERPWLTPALRASLAETVRLDRPHPREMVGANMAFSRAVLFKVPRFDVELGPGALGFADDTLFCRQLLEAGYRLTTALRICVEHHFEPNRLLRQSWLDFAKKQGKSRAYLERHWYHQEAPNPLARYVYASTRLSFWRLKRFQDCFRTEGFKEWELDVVCGAAAAEQHWRERRRPRNYSKRGLVKIAGQII